MYKQICAFLILATPVTADMPTARDAFQAGQFTKAIAELRPAAQSGNAEAEFLLGNIHGLGLGVEADPVRGFEWHFRAAMKGHPAAQLRISRAFEAGNGVAQDMFRAAVWAQLATVGAADGAAQQSAQLHGQLTAEMREAVDHIVQDYRLFLYPFSNP